MHENREISCTPWSHDQGRFAKAINRTADMNVQEKSDCAVVPVNQPNKEGQLSAEAGEGRAQTLENIVQSRMRPTQRGKRMSQGLPGVRRCGCSILNPLGCPPVRLVYSNPLLLLSIAPYRLSARRDDKKLYCTARNIACL